MNRLNVRLLGAFSIVLIFTLVIMWFALLFVLRSQPPNTDTEALELSAVVIETSQIAVERVLLARETARQQQENNVPLTERINAQTIDSIFRDTLVEQAETSNTRLLLVRGDNCILWDSHDGTEVNPRLLDTSMTQELILGTERRLSNDIFSGTLIDDDGSTWLYAGLPIVNINILFTARTNFTINRTLDNICGAADDEVNSVLMLLSAQPYPEQSVRSVIETYRDDGLFLALIQAVIIGLFFALIASYIIVRWVSRPLNDVASSAFAIAQGDYGRRAIIRGPDEVRLVANSFNQMAAQVQASRQAQQDFFANISHDLRTPLTSIQGFAQAIAEGVTDGKAAQRSAQIIQSEAERMRRMVADLLELARIQSGRVEMTKRVIDLNPILSIVGESLNVKAEQKGVRLHTHIENLPPIGGDGDRLAQVFTNLVDNAVKHTDADGDVWLHASRDQDGVRIEVADTGEGIPAEDVPRIFERFYQVDKSRAKLQGTGLGLAISKEIITAHNGRIWVESEYGTGTHFFVWLPALSNDSTTIIQRRT